MQTRERAHCALSVFPFIYIKKEIILSYFNVFSLHKNTKCYESLLDKSLASRIVVCERVFFLRIMIMLLRLLSNC